MAQMGNGARECEWCHTPEAHTKDFGDFEKKSVELSSALGEDGWLSLAHQSQASDLVAGATRVCVWGGGQNEKSS